MHDQSREIRALRMALDIEKAKNRRLVDELNWAEEQVRVYRRLIEKVARRDIKENPTHGQDR